MAGTPGHDIENGSNGVPYSSPAASEETPLAPLALQPTHPARSGLGVSKSAVSLVAMMGICAVTKTFTPVAPLSDAEHKPTLYKCYAAMALVTFVLLVVFVGYYSALAGGMCTARQGSSSVIRILMGMVVAATIAVYCLGASLQLAL